VVSRTRHLLYAGIAHGDITPDHFLVQQSENGELNCILIDFGFSAIRGQMRLPTVNEPWNAPELSPDKIHNSLDFNALSQTDIFSLGLVSLHILLPRSILERAGLFLIRKSTQDDNEWTNFVRHVETAKLVQAKSFLDEPLFDAIEGITIPVQQKEIIQKIVAASITPLAGNRTIPWTDIWNFVGEHLPDNFDRICADLQPPPLICSTTSTSHAHHVLFDVRKQHLCFVPVPHR